MRGVYAGWVSLEASRRWRVVVVFCGLGDSGDGLYYCCGLKVVVLLAVKN